MSNVEGRASLLLLVTSKNQWIKQRRIPHKSEMKQDLYDYG